MLLGVDTGGTFTDFVLITAQAGQVSLKIHKVLSTPDAPERAILQGIADLGLEPAVARGEVKVIHGTTVATNAALEGKGVKTAFVTNHGLRDLLTLGRQTRPQLYRLEIEGRAPPVAAELCFECGGRLDAKGELLDAVNETELEQAAEKMKSQGVKAVAINLLFSFLDERHELLIEHFLQASLGPEVFIARSSFVLPEYREYERGIATWLNACLGPLVQSYLLTLKEGIKPSPLAIMQSSGGTISADQAARRAVNLLLSGPAGGLAAALFIGRTIDEERLMTFDMGGTSTDVALIDGEIQLSNEGRIGPYPVSVPMVDMHTIGAGGGSIAYVDAGGLLQVGPQSAGAQPGPACYGNGGNNATVTDANLVLGRLLPEAFKNGEFKLDAEAARRSLARLGNPLGLGPIDAAQGVIELANDHMARALRVISVQRGYDPAKFRLCCFGGAGGLHICALADALQMTKALVPIHAGVLSALGMLVAPAERQLSTTYSCLLAAMDAIRFQDLLEQLKTRGKAQLLSEGVAEDKILFNTRVELRYLGQATSLSVPWHNKDRAEQDFHRLHERRYGHRLPDPVELVNLRVEALAEQQAPSLGRLTPGPDATAIGNTIIHGHHGEVPVFERSQLAPGQTLNGPCLIIEASATTMLETSWKATVDSYGNLLLEKND